MSPPYPPLTGRSGNVVYGFIMGGVNVILIVSSRQRDDADVQCFSIQEFVTHKGDELNDFHVPSIVAVAVAFGACKAG